MGSKSLELLLGSLLELGRHVDHVQQSDLELQGLFDGLDLGLLGLLFGLFLGLLLLVCLFLLLVSVGLGLTTLIGFTLAFLFV